MADEGPNVVVLRNVFRVPNVRGVGNLRVEVTLSDYDKGVVSARGAERSIGLAREAQSRLLRSRKARASPSIRVRQLSPRMLMRSSEPCIANPRMIPPFWRSVRNCHTFSRAALSSLQEEPTAFRFLLTGI